MTAVTPADDQLLTDAIASLSSMGEIDRPQFQQMVSAYSEMLNATIAVSKATGGHLCANRWEAWPTYVLTRLCLMGKSLRILLFEGDSASIDYTLDVGSIGVLTRTMIEGSVLFHYVTEEGLSEDTKKLRTTIFDLHDCSRRSRFLKGIGQPAEYKKNKVILPLLRARLSKNPEYLALPDDEKKELRDGNHIFVGGLRRAARNAGWDITFFDALHTYLSMQSHMAPMSFQRMPEQIDFVLPAQFQFGYAVMCLDLLRNALAACALKALDIFPDIGPTLPASQLEVLKS